MLLLHGSRGPGGRGGRFLPRQDGDADVSPRAPAVATTSSPARSPNTWAGTSRAIPTLIVQNMPGAGGARMVNFLYNVARRMGPLLGVPLAPGRDGAGARPLPRSSTTPPGSTGSAISRIPSASCSSGMGHRPRPLADAMARVTPLAGSGKSSATYQLPVLANALLGTKFNVVLGYPGAAEMEMRSSGARSMAGQRSGRRFNTTQPSWIKEGKVRIIIQSVLKRSPQLPDTPTYIELAKTDEARRDFRIHGVAECHGPHPLRPARRARRTGWPRCGGHSTPWSRIP